MEFAVRRSGTDVTSSLSYEDPAPRLGTAGGFARAAAHLQEVLRHARAGHSGVCAVHGLAGSGKSFVLREALAHTDDFTRVTLPARPGDTSFEAWQMLFDLAASSAPPEELSRVAQAAIEASAGSGRAPLLLVFDGCAPGHAAAVLATAAAVFEPELLVPTAFVVTWRDDLAGSAPPLQFDLPSHRLEPLTEEQSVELMDLQGEASADRSVLDAVWRMTGGNPAGMVSSVSRLSRDELSGLVPLPMPLPLGIEVADAFGSWIDTLGDAARLAVTVAAVADLPRTALEDALSYLDLTPADLEPARLCGMLSIGAERVRFVHPLCRAAVFELASHESQRAARRAVLDALVAAQRIEEAAALGGTARIRPDETLRSLCIQASLDGVRASNYGSAARCLLLASRVAPSEDEAARHLIDASSMWQAAGRPDRARACLQRVPPNNLSATVVGHATYRAARDVFAHRPALEPVREMATGAELCVQSDPDLACGMLADAAASAVLVEAYDAAIAYAQRALALARDHAGSRTWALFARDAVTTIVSGPGALEERTLQDSMMTLLGTDTPFSGSPQLAFVLGSALVHVATPAMLQRWLAWMDDGQRSITEPGLRSALALVRSRARLYAGDVPGATRAAAFAVDGLAGLGDVALSARALGWSSWVHAVAGQTTPSLEAASRFFALDQPTPHLPLVQVLSALVHSELQKGRVRTAHSWLHALEDECDSSAGARDCFDWPSLQVFLQLSLLSHYEPEQLGADVPVPPGVEQSFTGETPDRSSAYVEAHRKLVAALKQRRIGSAAAAHFNFSRAATEFQECGANGWSRLAAAQLGERPNQASEVGTDPDRAPDRTRNITAEETPTDPTS